MKSFITEKMLGFSVFEVFTSSVEKNVPCKNKYNFKNYTVFEVEFLKNHSRYIRWESCV